MHRSLDGYHPQIRSPLHEDPQTLLEDVVARAFRNPFDTAEWEEVREELARREAEVEVLGLSLAKERADVEWIERPLVRAALWLFGELASREEKERAEYEHARSLVLQKGVPAQELRMWLEGLQPDATLSDDQVFAALEGASSRMLASVPLDLTELYAQVKRFRVCMRAAELLGIDLRREEPDPKLLGHLQRQLAAVGATELAALAESGVPREHLLVHLEAVPRPARLARQLKSLAKRALFEHT